MSDMYLVLRHRLDTVATEWVQIDTAVLHAAMKARGFSYESFARQIPVSAKTAERWVKRGRVPVFHIDKVAEVLDLEIERPTFERPVVRVEGTSPIEGFALAQILDRLDRLEAEEEAQTAALDELLRIVRDMRDEQDDPPMPRSASA